MVHAGDRISSLPGDDAALWIAVPSANRAEAGRGVVRLVGRAKREQRAEVYLEPELQAREDDGQAGCYCCDKRLADAPGASKLRAVDRILLRRFRM